MKKKQLRNLIQEELKNQLKEQPKQVDPSVNFGGQARIDDIGPYTGGGFPLEPDDIGKGDDVLVNPVSMADCHPDNPSFSEFGGVQVFLDDQFNSLDIILGDGYPAPIWQAEYDGNDIVGDNWYESPVTSGNYCYGPVTIPNNWICCSANNNSDSDLTQTYTIGGDVYGGYVYDWQGIEISSTGAYNSCYCPGAENVNGQTLCNWDGNPTTQDYITYLSEIGYTDDQPIEYGSGVMHPKIVSTCVAGADLSLPQACLDDGTLTGDYTSQYYDVYADTGVAMEACNYISNPHQLTVADYTWTAGPGEGDEDMGPADEGIDTTDGVIYTNNVGLCDYGCYGCTDEGATNYNANSTVDDGSCTYAGCINPYATVVMGEGYTECTGCEGVSAPESCTGDGGCTGCEFNYCGDETALNYVCTLDEYVGAVMDPVIQAVCDPLNDLATPYFDIGVFTGTCLYDETANQGCADPNALNYDSTIPSANNDICKCVYAFCNDDSSNNAASVHTDSTGTPTGCGNWDPTLSDTCFNDNGSVNQELMDLWNESEAVNGGCIDNSICQFRGCNDATGVPLDFLTGVDGLNDQAALAPGTPVPGYFAYDCDSSTGMGEYQLYYYHQDNFGCAVDLGDGTVETDAAGNAVLDEDNTDCCFRPGCPDSNATNYTNDAANIGFANYQDFSNLSTFTVAGLLAGDYGSTACVDDDSVVSSGLVPPSCDYAQEGCGGEPLNYGPYFGFEPSYAINYNPIVTDNDGTSCEYCKDAYVVQCSPTLPEGYGIVGAPDNPLFVECLTINKFSEGEVVPAVDDIFQMQGLDYDIWGCNEPSACNYCENPQYGDPYPCTGCEGGGTSCCEFPPIGMDCDGNVTTVINGCTDPSACNYDENANTDNGQCEYDSCQGCTDSSASNYSSSATVDDGSCQYNFGCEYCPPVYEYSECADGSQCPPTGTSIRYTGGYGYRADGTGYVTNCNVLVAQQIHNYQPDIETGFVGINWSSGNDNYGSACDCEPNMEGPCEGWVKGPICDRPMASMNMNDALQVHYEAAYCYPVSGGTVQNDWTAQFYNQYFWGLSIQGQWMGDSTSMLSQIQNNCMSICMEPEIYNCENNQTCRWACEDIQWGGPAEFQSRGCGNPLFNNDWWSNELSALH